MSHLLRYEEWQGAGRAWYCNDTSDLKNGSALWWLPARMLKKTPAEYVKMVIEDFHPDYIYCNSDGSFVSWCWENQNDMRRFKNYINAVARRENFIIC